jgi:hypothetical protein
MDSDDFFKGFFDITFVNGDRMFARITHPTYGLNGKVLYIWGSDNTCFNFDNIIKLTKTKVETDG